MMFPALLLAALAAACNPTSPAAPAAKLEKSPAGLEQTVLTIRSGAKQHRFTVEIARTPEEQAKGMMFRNSLAPDKGMLFPLDPPRVAAFWMQNTLIPLDMVFIRTDGTIASIEPNAVPLSLETVQSKEVVGAVLELAGGRAAELGLKAGDKVEWSG